MALELDRFLERAAEAKRESKYVEFKEQFDLSVEGERIELLKDFVAIANSGGGVVIVGVANDSSPSGADVQAVLALDGAKIGDKLARYTGDNFDEFEVHEMRRRGKRAAAIIVGAVAAAPLVFQQQGSYMNPQGRPKTAFHRGAVYFRHGAKSEPATSDDLRVFIERRLDLVRNSWLGGIKRVISAPRGSEIVAIQRTRDEEGEPNRIRITTDEDAPVYGRIDPDDTHPHRQTELIAEVNKKLPRETTINSYDVQAVRRVHEIDPKTRPDFAHQGKFDLAPQYSDELVDWLVEQHRRDDQFFARARAEYANLMHARQ
jgi:hypothetical protein